MAIVISVVSLIISLTLFIRTLLQEKTNMSIEIINVAIASVNSKKIHVNVMFTNKSKNPITITSAKIETTINHQQVVRYARYLTYRAAHNTIRTNNKSEVVNQEIYTDPIPIRIESYGARHSLITFDLIDIKEKDFTNNSTFIEFTTSRGNINQIFRLKNYKKTLITKFLD